MVLCGSREDPKEVEPLAAPEGSQPGDKVNNNNTGVYKVPYSPILGVGGGISSL